MAIIQTISVINPVVELFLVILGFLVLVSLLSRDDGKKGELAKLEIKIDHITNK